MENNIKKINEKDPIEEKEIFVGEEDEIVLSCEGQPCNFIYSKAEEL